jgi:hypothetical protein
VEKKNPYVTTVGFNKDDPDHVQVAELLNSMGRGKARYLVKAVLVYQNMLETGQAPMVAGGSVDYELLRRMVIQILDERNEQVGIEAKVSENTEPEQVEENMLEGLDDVTLDGIMASLMFFHGQ